MDMDEILDNFENCPIFFKFHLEPSVDGGVKICTNGHGLSNKMAVMPIKTFKNLLQNQESFKVEFWYIVWRTRGLPSLFK